MIIKDNSTVDENGLEISEIVPPSREKEFDELPVLFKDEEIGLDSIENTKPARVSSKPKKSSRGKKS